MSTCRNYKKATITRHYSKTAPKLLRQRNLSTMATLGTRKWSLQRGLNKSQCAKYPPKRWLLQKGGRYGEVAIRGSTVFIYQLFWTQACPEGMCMNGTHRSHARCHPCPIPQPIKVGHTTRVYDPSSFQIVMQVQIFYVPQNQSVKVL